jgi:hypothetical protein
MGSMGCPYERPMERVSAKPTDLYPELVNGSHATRAHCVERALAVPASNDNPDLALAYASRKIIPYFRAMAST